MDAAVVINSENENPQFIISLEEVDMGLLPLQNYRRWQKMKTKAVWDILDSRRGPEYYEFELHSKDTSEDECLEVQRCHICDVEVPVAFQEDHSRSPRHRAYSTIAEIALDKTRRQISIVSSVGTSHGNWHYCLSCSCAVSVSNIQEHENSEEHNIALKFEKLISAFALIYQDKSNVTRLYDEIKNDISELAIIKDKEGNIETTFLDTLKVSYAEINMNDGISNKTDATKIVQNNCNVYNKTDADTLDLEAYISDINQNSMHIVKCIDNAVLITTMSGAVIKIDLDNFHGFFDSGNKTICKLCREVVVYKNKHCLEARHKEKLKKTIINKHGIRQLDNIWSHCLLCNEIVENSEAHVLCTDDHHRFLQSAVLIDEKPDVEPTKSDTSADTQANNLHQPNNDHKYNSWLANKETVLHHHFKNTHIKNYKKCMVCDVTIFGNNHQIINQHIASESHIKEHTQLLQINCMKKVNNKTYNCNACSLYISNLKDLVHILSPTHEKNMREVKEKAEREKAEKERAEKLRAAAATASNTDGVKNGYCYICNVKVTDNHNNIKTHINGQNHRDNKIIKEGIPVINGFCKICEVKVPDNQTNITQHINGQFHREAKNRILNL